MTEDEDLFGNITPTPPSDEPLKEMHLPDRYVTLLRAALDRQGLATMADRQALIEKLTGRQVSTLRDLEPPEALAILESLAEPPVAPRGSSWAERDGDTWIDRL